MKNILGLVQGPPCRIDVDFKDERGRRYTKTAVVKGKGGEAEELPLFTNHDAVCGEVRITPLTTKRVEHAGIKVQLLGQIELASERATPHAFVSLVRELAPPGDIASAAQKPLPFEFRNVEMQYDSYRGLQVRCRYLLRVTVTGKGMVADTKRDAGFWVRNYEAPPEPAPPIKMEVGIEECLHIEFEYDKARYHLKDVVVGKIYFLLVRIKLKHMEVEVRRRETTGAGSSAHNESETIAKYEIMDGAPVRGENIPIRLYLSPYDLTPSYKDVHNKFSVRYFLNLVLVDEEDRRYFKQQEIALYRSEEGAGSTGGNAANGSGAAAQQAPPPPPMLHTPAPAAAVHAAAAAPAAAPAQPPQEQPPQPQQEQQQSLAPVAPVAQQRQSQEPLLPPQPPQQQPEQQEQPPLFADPSPPQQPAAAVVQQQQQPQQEDELTFGDALAEAPAPIPAADGAAS